MRLAAALSMFGVIPLTLAGSVQGAPIGQDASVAPIFAHFVQWAQPGCAVGAMRDGQVIQATGYGIADVAADKLITRDTVNVQLNPFLAGCSR